jgi:DNA helicase II / ATP-dependent DNA helicase PcrA
MLQNSTAKCFCCCGISNGFAPASMTFPRWMLKPKPGNPVGEVKLVQWLSMTHEAQGVTKFVRKKIESEEVKPGEILILAPRRQFGYAIRDEMAAKEIPVHSFFSEELFEGDFTKKGGCPAIEPYALLCLLADPDDRVALRVWCGAGHSDLRRETWALVRAHCEASVLSPREVLEQTVGGQIKLHGNKVAVKGLLERYKKLKVDLAECSEIRGKALFNRLFPSNQAWAEPVRALADQIGGDWTTQKVYEAVTGHIAQPELPTDVDYVRVMSLHKSKGLTAKMVVVTGCIEGVMPYVKSNLPLAEELRKTEEQRRLVYVAITRATDILMLSSVLSVPISVAKNMGVKVASTSGPDAFTITTRFWQEFGLAAPTPILGTDL